MPSVRQNYPFSAVVSQEQFKLALLLVAVNPLVGGVLISGPRGSAKSTLAKGVADILPRTVSDCSDHKHQLPPFVTLPLGASEEMLIGSLNLQKVLNEKTLEFQPGLLAKAHKGVLYVDEVNLLPDNLVDQLLDVAVSGVNTVERDGISHQHLADFILLGTMNPDEGELRSQLTDRFGLFVSLSNQYEVDERIDIVRRRELFDNNAETFIEQYATGQDHLSVAIAQAQTLLPKVSCPDSCRRLIAERASAAQVDGVRADIAWVQAALANAALAQRTSVNCDDVLAVEDLVLGHRRNTDIDNTSSPQNSGTGNNHSHHQPQARPPFSRPDSTRATDPCEPGSDTNPNKDNGQGDSSTQDGSSGQSGSNGQGASNFQSASNSQGEWGAMTAQTQPTQSLADVVRLKAIFSNRSRIDVTRPISEHRVVSDTVSFTTKQFKTQSSKLHWFNTLAANFGQWPLKTLRFCQRKNTPVVIHLVLLDTSGSILANQGFAKAKGLIMQIAEHAYVHRERFSILGFGAQQVHTVIGLRRAPKTIRRILDAVQAGGGTPLHAAIEKAAKIQSLQLKKNPLVIFKSYILTDGRIHSCDFSSTLTGDVVVVDIEQSHVKRGKAKHIASALNADYLPLMV